MIKTPINKILFIDIETVGITKDYDSLQIEYPKLAHQFDNYIDWFQKRFPEDKDKSHNDIFIVRAALVPEFAKIVCVSVAFILENGTIKKQSFSDHNEKVLLSDCQKLLDRCGKLDFYLCGHNLKNFDIPMLAKRMVINGILPPSILPSYDTKPWDIKAIDTREIWQFGAYTAIGSLELMCTCMDVISSKEGEVTGDKVHDSYWNLNMIKEITEYCERDVNVLIEIIKKLKDLK